LNAVTDPGSDSIDSAARTARLESIATRMLERARAQGATEAEVSCSEQHGLSVGVRMGEVETVESTRDRGIAVTVYFGQRKGSASTADLREDSLEATVSQACAIAKVTEDDPAAGLADAALMATDLREFDAWHPWGIGADRAIDLALACETAGREADPRIDNSDGASVSSGASLGVYANSHGFIGHERGTHHAISCALIAGQGAQMQRDGWYTTALSADDLEAPAAVGSKAAERAVARLDARQLPTAQMPVLFSAEMARSLIGHLVGAVSGGALYRKASFLLDAAGQSLFPEWFSVLEDPFLARGFRSSSFDAEGVATQRSALIEAGVLQRYVLGSYSARKLGLATTANAGGIHNLLVSANAGSQRDIVSGMQRGLLVTELMGQGVNTVTGDYSRGASGFLIDNGAVTHAVDGITIAGNLRDMFAAIEAVGRDVDPRSHVRTGPILVGRMTVAGAQ
jgi:PmbA protein